LGCCAATHYAAFSFYIVYYSMFPTLSQSVTYHKSHFFSCDKVCARSLNVTSFVSPFLRSLWKFFHFGFKFSSFVFLLANKRSGMCGGNGGYQKQKLKSFIIIKLSSKICLYFNTSIHHSLQLLYLTLPYMVIVFLWCEA